MIRTLQHCAFLIALLVALRAQAQGLAYAELRSSGTGDVPGSPIPTVELERPLPGGSELEWLLTQGRRLRWTVIGSEGLPISGCENVPHYYTFDRDSSFVREEGCGEAGPFNTGHPYRITRTSSGEVIAIGDITYEVRRLPPSAPVCEGEHEACLRMSSLSFGKMDRSTNIYLVR